MSKHPLAIKLDREKVPFTYENDLPIEVIVNNDLCMEIEDELDRLNAIVERLPKTADGVAVLVDDLVYDANGDPRRVAWAHGNKYFVGVSGQDYRHGRKEPVPGASKDLDISHCYSTREAAEAAQEATNQ
jgi:hypothetical protein